METTPKRNGSDLILEHIADCTDAQALVVVDGSADEIVAQMVAAGWTLRERVDQIAGKRIRFLEPPAAPEISEADGEAERHFQTATGEVYDD